MREILLLRHAEPESARSYIGRGSDVGLSPQGRIAAERIAESLAAQRPERLYVSPMRRAMETMAPVATMLRLPMKVMDDLTEIDFGDWEGLDWRSIEERGADAYHSWVDNPWKHSPPGGETLRELKYRVITAFEGMLAEQGRFLLVSHAGPMRLILSHALNIHPQSSLNIGIAYGGFCRFRQMDRGILKLQQWNVNLMRDSGPAKNARDPDEKQ